MLDLKFSQAGGSIGDLRGGEVVVERAEVDDGLKGVREGTMRALRFWIILSSMVARERRRKSVQGRVQLGLREGEVGMGLPRRARWLRQNWGVNGGVVSGVWAISSLGGSDGEGSGGGFEVAQKRPATLG